MTSSAQVESCGKVSIAVAFFETIADLRVALVSSGFRHHIDARLVRGRRCCRCGPFFFTRRARPGVDEDWRNRSTCVARRSRGHRRDDQVDPAGLERGNETLERRILDLDFAMMGSVQRMSHLHAHAGRIARRIRHLKRRIVQLHADDQRLASNPSAGARDRPDAESQRDQRR